MQGLEYFGKVWTQWCLGALVTPGFKDIFPESLRHNRLWSLLRRGGTEALVKQVTQKGPLGALQTVQQQF